MPLYEEYTAGDGNHLVIVDVQKDFSQWMPDGYLQRVHDHAKSVPNVYQVWDANRTDGPSEKFENEKMTVPKRYGYNLRKEDVRNYFTGESQRELESDMDSDKFHCEQGRRKTYRARDGKVLFYVGKSHKFFMAEPELMKMMEYLKQLNSKIIIIGGADNECLADVEACMDHYEIPFERKHDLIYPVKKEEAAI